MNLKKVVRAIIGTFAIFGTLIIIGAVGTMDYNVLIGKDYPLSMTFKTILTGFSFIIPYILVRCADGEK